MTTKVTLSTGESHICDDHGDLWVSIRGGDWIPKDSPLIVETVEGRLVFVPDPPKETTVQVDTTQP